MTKFDALMESHPVNSLYHAVRLFNVDNYLFAYIELFNTFQYYVLLSGNYNKAKHGNNLEVSYSNVIEIKKIDEKDLLKKLTPVDLKDAMIVSKENNIDMTELFENTSCNCVNNQENLKLFFHKIGKMALKKIKSELYIKDYWDLIQTHYSNIFKHYINKACIVSFNINELAQLYEDFKIYLTANDKIKIENYKKYLPNGGIYPYEIYKILSNTHSEQVRLYCNYKFNMLARLISLKSNVSAL